MHKKKHPVYKPDDADKRKHKEGWGKPEPGFVIDADGHPVGKCPTDISGQEAQHLLDEGEAQPGRNARSPYPERVYNVRQGIPYQAHAKAPGRYHGFPELPSRIHPTIRERLRVRALAAGDLAKFEAWQTLVAQYDQ